jgi:serine/threonine protein kinase
VAVEGDRTTVTAHESPQGTLVNGTKISAPQGLKLGDVIRLGNSYLRLEPGDAPLPDGADEPMQATARASETQVKEPETPARSPAKTAEAPAKAPETPGKIPELPTDRLKELTGYTLSHYKIGALLGHGYYGPVFRAQDIKNDQSVALKILPAAFPVDTDEMRSFVLALKRILFLQHAGLVLLRGIGKTGPYVWLAKELIEGESAAARIQRMSTMPKIKWRPALRMAVQMARTLEFLHRNHLVHGNITPMNVLTPADGGVARINDLGLWDALAGTELQKEVVEEKFLDELPYLSPEHVDPDAQVDDLSDQYCAGAVLYALLTGRPPFEDSDPQKTVDWILEGGPPKPKDIQRTIPDEFQAVVLRMLARRPEERYLGPADLRADLERIAEANDELV